MAEIDDGTGPDNELELKDRFLREIKSPMLSGTTPDSELDDKFKDSRFSRRVMDGGMSPLSLLPERSRWEMLECQLCGTPPERLAREMVAEVSFFK